MEIYHIDEAERDKLNLNGGKYYDADFTRDKL